LANTHKPMEGHCFLGQEFIKYSRDVCDNCRKSSAELIPAY
jgi:hypothetical protein